jgi:hypothetical protein
VDTPQLVRPDAGDDSPMAIVMSEAAGRAARDADDAHDDPHLSFRRERSVAWGPHADARWYGADTCGGSSWASPRSRSTGSAVRPHHQSARILNIYLPSSARVRTHSTYLSVLMWFRVACSEWLQIIVRNIAPVIPLEFETGIPGAIVHIVLRIYRRRHYLLPWVCDWFDPASGCRYEAFYETRVDANACRRAVLLEAGS